MTTYTIDTAAAIKHLVECGLEERQAQGIVDTFAESQGDVVTKSFLQAELKALRAQLTGRLWIAVGSFVALSQALDYVLPMLGGS